MPKGFSKHLRQTLLTTLWVIFFLLVIDVAVNTLFRYPTDPTVTTASNLATYFEYGRSTEGKLARMLGPTNEGSAPIAKAGWLNPPDWEAAKTPTRPAAGENRLIAFYGMSFSNAVADELKAIDPTIGLRKIAGPSAPPNFTFAAYNLDRGRHEADAVVLALLASSVKAMTTLNGMTWQFEAPAPYTFPRYVVENGALKAIEPPIHSLSELRAAFQNPQQWQAFTDQLRAHDRFYSDFLFSRSWLDRSAIARMIRRSVAQRHQSVITNQIHNDSGFHDPEIVQVLQAMVTEFSKTARADGKVPIVLVLNDRGFSDHLFQAVRPALESSGVPYVSTHTIAPATDIRNFVGDGHFTKEVDQQIAKAVLELVNKEVPKRS